MQFHTKCCGDLLLAGLAAGATQGTHLPFGERTGVLSTARVERQQASRRGTGHFPHPKAAQHGRTVAGQSVNLSLSVRLANPIVASLSSGAGATLLCTTSISRPNSGASIHFTSRTTLIHASSRPETGKGKVRPSLTRNIVLGRR